MGYENTAEPRENVVLKAIEQVIKDNEPVPLEIAVACILSLDVSRYEFNLGLDVLVRAKNIDNTDGMLRWTGDRPGKQQI